MFRIYNSLSHQIENFKPIQPPHVGMYTCGPTVYDHMHIGNLRTFILSDVLFRVLQYNRYQVKAVQNITDIDDKIIKRANEQNVSIEQISKKFTDYFINDVGKLNMKLSRGVQPKATEYVNEMVDYILDLMKEGLAYKEQDGSVYFDISKFPDYGKLSHLDKRELKPGTRVISDEYSKENAYDFALWKAVPEGEIGSFSSKLGWGRPGWHIECSAMSQSILGNRFDIHVGGIDLLFPHHENEIAQSEGRTGEKPFVKYWIHGAHMLVDGKKMSKSLHNFYTLTDVIKKGFDPKALRYLYLQVHYRQEMNFTWEALEGAQNSLKRLWSHVGEFDDPKIGCAEFEEMFENAISDDLNMPQALSVVWELIKSDYPTSAKMATLLKFDEVLGLDLKKVSDKEKSSLGEKSLPEEIQQLLKKRDNLRRENNFEEADAIRDQIREKGYEIEDKDNKTIIKEAQKSKN